MRVIPLLYKGEIQVIYLIDVSSWTDNPTNPQVLSVTDTLGDDVKSTVMPSGAPSISGTDIILPRLEALTDKVYMINLMFNADGNTLTISMSVDLR